MKKLKWFSGGNERAEQAIQLIDELLRDFDDSSSHSDRLRTVLRKPDVAFSGHPARRCRC